MRERERRFERCRQNLSRSDSAPALKVRGVITVPQASATVGVLGQQCQPLPLEVHRPEAPTGSSELLLTVETGSISVSA